MNFISLFARGFLRSAPRCLLAFLIVFAPFAYGLTRPEYLLYFDQVALVLFGLFLLDCGVRRRWPDVPLWPLAGLCLLGLQGWWMTLNAHSYHLHYGGTNWVRVLDAPLRPHSEGSIDRNISLEFMWRYSALFCVMLVALSLSRVWKERMLVVFAVSAVAFAVFGIAFKLAGEPWMRLLWEGRWARSTSVFGTYRYHGNAATYLYLALAVHLGFAWAAFAGNANPLKQGFWILGGTIILAALMLNTSRAGWIVGAAVLVVFGLAILVVGTIQRGATASDGTAGLKRSVAILCVAVVLVAPFVVSWKIRNVRIENTLENLEMRYPAPVYQVMAGETPAWGFGPGTFPLAFQPFQRMYADLMPNPKVFLREFWNVGHQDYYQTWFEWGRNGAAIWACLVGSALLAGFARLFGAVRAGNPRGAILTFSVLTGIGGFMGHAMFDFPMQAASLHFLFLLLLACCWPERDARRVAARAEA